ncbi:MOSC N-terminal beta barrel domain-containing protein [uncultured Ferrimonas sp.]|uniref:MOSC domain-containing protein n=1 Tax=uncultured Ferrimonas sp. TaxID=432640 RepID=UPI00261D3B74|nr:MOSC N-terminal beta barrel domain-containing protein [uncultured Ferrimonas sp.]
MSQITELWIYPVKGLAGISVAEAQLDATGLRWDRHWMVVDDRGRFVTQRQLPQMATVHTALTSDALILSHPSQAQPLRVALAESTAARSTAVRVWDDRVEADCIDAAGGWLTQALQSRRPLHLVRFAATSARPVSAKYLGEQERSHTHFADGYPVLVANQQTLALLNDTLAQAGEHTVPMSRFRANVVMDDLGGANAELAQQDLHGEAVILGIRKPCERCPVTRIDQLSGERQHPQQPLPALMSINPLEKKGAFFGGNAIVLQTGVIRVGDRLTSKP